MDKALLEAAKQGLVKCVQGLLEKGANVNKALEEEYNHCCHYRCKRENGHETFIGTLIQAGADVNKYENLKDTSPVMYAVNRDNTRCLEMLITAGAAVNVALGYNTLLAQAASKGHLNSLRCLIKAGALVNVADGYDKATPLIRAAKGAMRIR